jgi:uncharacterized membrane protein
MNEDRQRVIVQETAAPRWILVVGVVVAVVSVAAFGAGWTASKRSKALEQILAADNQQLKQQEDILGQRLAKAEDTNAQMQGKLSVVTGKMKLTEGELRRARRAAAKIKDDNAKQLTDLQNSLNGQLARKASVDDLKKIGTDVDGVKTDLETTKNNLNMARGEFGTLIAKNHDEIEELRRLGDRDYYEFTINKRHRERVGDIMVELRGVNTKRNLYTVALYVDDARYDKKNRSVNEPIYFFTRGNGHAPLEFVVNQVGKNKINGYLSMLKAQSMHTQTPGN